MSFLCDSFLNMSMVWLKRKKRGRIVLNYQEALQYIESIQVSLGSDYSLKEVTELSKCVGRPERKLKIIHIAGTNGKGSVGNYIANILAACGYTVGRYVSPTIFEYRERIQRVFSKEGKNYCEYVSEEEVAQSLSQLRQHCEQMQQDGFLQPTAFEIETIMAFMVFASWKTDIVILETGLGGRLDATNMIEHPLQCIFTSISMDHMQILGDTLEKIAKEKYGIIKYGTRVISLEQNEIKTLLLKECKAKNAEASFVNPNQIKEESLESAYQSFNYKGKLYSVKQAGTYQKENASIAIESVFELKKQGFDKISYDSIKNGLIQSQWRGRFEIVSKEPFLLVDGAHNEEAAVRLRESLEKYFPKQHFVFIFGTFRDKEYEKVLLQILPIAKKIYTVKAQGERGLGSDVLSDTVKKILSKNADFVSQVYDCGMTRKALEKAWNEDSNEKIIVCGSLSILKDVYNFLDK